MRRRTSFVLALVASLVGCALIAFGTWSRLSASSPPLVGQALQGAAPEPDVTLTDQDGRPFRLFDERGKELVLFFGYAHCPDVCPTTLAKLAQARKLLSDRARDVNVAFVTIDPERDKQADLKRYVDLFDPSFYGLTGTPKELDTLYAAYHVWHEKLPSQGSAVGYLMAHTSTIYMLDRSGRLRVLHDWSDSPKDLAHDMKALLGDGGSSQP